MRRRGRDRVGEPVGAQTCPECIARICTRSSGAMRFAPPYTLLRNALGTGILRPTPAPDPRLLRRRQHADTSVLLHQHKPLTVHPTSNPARRDGAPSKSDWIRRFSSGSQNLFIRHLHKKIIRSPADSMINDCNRNTFADNLRLKSGYACREAHRKHQGHKNKHHQASDLFHGQRQRPLKAQAPQRHPPGPLFFSEDKLVLQ